MGYDGEWDENIKKILEYEEFIEFKKTLTKICSKLK